MTTPNSRIFPQTPKANTVNLTTANTVYGAAPNNAVLLATAGASGAQLTKLQAIPCVTIATANQLQVFRSYDAGATKFFAESALMATYTMAQNTEAPTTDFGYSADNPLVLAPNERLYVAEGQSVSVNVIAEWADF